MNKTITWTSRLYLCMILCVGPLVAYAQESDSLIYEKWLQNVEVTARHTLYRTFPDKIVYNVGADSSLVGKTTFDALRYTPMLIVRRNGEISTVGDWPVEYLVNGRNEPGFSGDIHDASESLDAKYVKRIEVRLERDTDGSEKLQVNIVTKGRLLGYRGVAHSNLYDDRWRNGAFLFTKRGKWGLSLSYANLWTWGHKSTEHSDEWRYNELPLYHISRHGKSSGHRVDMNNLEATLTYELSPLKVFSLYGQTQLKANSHSFGTTNVLAEDNYSNLTYQYTRSTSYRREKDAEYRFSADYEWLFGENAEHGKFYAEYEFYRRPTRDKTTANYDHLSYAFPEYVEDFYNMDDRSHEFENWHSVLAMFRRKMDNHEVMVENLFRYRHEGEEVWRLKHYDYAAEMHTVSDWSKYIHRQAAEILKAGYTYTGSKFQAGVGAVGTYLYDSSEMLERDNEFSFKQKFISPYADISYVPTSLSRVKLSYGMGRRIPDIGAMNPYVYTDVPGRVSYGNPALKAETAHALSLSYDFHLGKVNLYAATSHSFSKDIILRHQFLKDGLLHITQDNIGKRYDAQWTANASSKFTRTTWGRIDARLYFTDYAETTLYKRNKGCTFSTNASIEQELPKHIDISAGGGYTSPWIYLQGKGSNSFNYQLRLDKSFPKRRLTLGAEASSFVPLHYKTKRDVSAEGYYSMTRNRSFHASFLVSVRWRFGKLRAEEHEREEEIEHSDIKYGYDK